MVKDYIVAIFVSLVIVVACYLLNKYALSFKIPDFIIGWFGCMGYYITFYHDKIEE